MSAERQTVKVEVAILCGWLAYMDNILKKGSLPRELRKSFKKLYKAMWPNAHYLVRAGVFEANTELTQQEVNQLTRDLSSLAQDAEDNERLDLDEATSARINLRRLSGIPDAELAHARHSTSAYAPAARAALARAVLN